ncbi:YwqG family protein [Micropruina sp.]|uniref:YwqG family protein n=1 Tax=Micropruina sp. TaxID=2737536 RepID=UPI0039E2B6A1
MRLASWLLTLLGVVVLAVASMPLWPRSSRLRPPSGGEAAMLAVLGLACLAAACLFMLQARRAVRADQLRQQGAAEAQRLIRSGLFDDYVELTQQPVVRLEEAPGDTHAYATNLGGPFYAPPGFDWPRTALGQLMLPLAQLNFAELPRLPGFPDSGMLQFFIADEDSYGMDLDNLTSQTGFRVIYHREVGEITLPNPVPVASDAEGLPFPDALRLVATPASMVMPASDWRCTDAVAASWRRHLGHLGEPSAEVVRGLVDAVAEAGYSGSDDRLLVGGHQMGGYPQFTQEDPREGAPQLRGHTTVLLLLDSTGSVNWGDAGVGCFLIEPQRLANRDFSNVMYSWDCG